MKKFFLMSALLMCVSGVIGQSRFGIKGGLNLANEYSRIDNQSATTDVAASFHITGYFDGRVSRGFSIQPGLSLQGKGGRYEANGQKFTDRLLYLEIPVNFLGRVQAGRGEVFFGGGPYLAYGLDARVKYERNATHIEWGSNPDQLNPFDAGLGILAGYTFNSGLSLSLSNSIGFVNISNQEGGASFRNQVVSISIGYEFGRR
ncbi:outer membrane beta-barrel protein [Sphingobacterium sp. LRF_L2]|uniref:outer membrane beta-barrel protein n=1 Tax=Sphingobacterium sp. LRF_L2 TaxID=3369421 RepID=UPI003F5E88E7